MESQNQQVDYKNEVEPTSMSDILNSSSDSCDNLDVLVRHGYNSPEANAAHDGSKEFLDWKEFKEQKYQKID